jgi:hypothetical protein
MLWHISCHVRHVCDGYKMCSQAARRRHLAIQSAPHESTSFIITCISTVAANKFPLAERFVGQRTRRSFLWRNSRIDLVLRSTVTSTAAFRRASNIAGWRFLFSSVVLPLRSVSICFCSNGLVRLRRQDVSLATSDQYSLGRLDLEDGAVHSARICRVKRKRRSHCDWLHLFDFDRCCRGN